MKITVTFFIAITLFLGKTAYGQQQIVDDAAITTERSIQLETWYGYEESVFMPAVGITSWLELGAGLVFDSRNDMKFTSWTAEAKVVNGDVEQAGQAVGMIVGLGFDHTSTLSEFFIYVPYSRMMLNDSSMLHINLGTAVYEDWGTQIEPLFGIGVEFGVHDWFTILGEVYGLGDEIGVQGGVGISLIPELLSTDIMYGRGSEPFLDSIYNHPGFSVGLAFTPGRLW